MSFLGGWSTGGTVTSPNTGGGGGWSTGTSSSGGGGGWSTGSVGGSSGGWLAPAPVVQTSYPVAAVSYPAVGYADYQAGAVAYTSPGAGLHAGPFGEGGPYTPLDFPLLHELRPGERLEDLQARLARRSLVSFLLLGIVAFLLLRK